MDNQQAHQITRTQVLTLVARASIRQAQALQAEQSDQAMELGRRLLERALERLSPGNSQSHFNARLPLLATGDNRTLDRILEDIGNGKSLAVLVAEQMVRQGT